jgi:endogenous inhibitor of DNA gyrase (YacG/DUF329 family)
MTSPCEDITVQCPQCNKVYKDWWRPSFNPDLGEVWDDDYMRQASTATCPDCGHVVELAMLIVRGKKPRRRRRRR